MISITVSQETTQYGRLLSFFFPSAKKDKSTAPELPVFIDLTPAEAPEIPISTGVKDTSEAKTTEPIYINLASVSTSTSTPEKTDLKSETVTAEKVNAEAAEAAATTTVSATKATTKTTAPVFVELAETSTSAPAKVVKKKADAIAQETEDVADVATSATKATTKTTAPVFVELAETSTSAPAKVADDVADVATSATKATTETEAIAKNSNPTGEFNDLGTTVKTTKVIVEEVTTAATLAAAKAAPVFIELASTSISSEKAVMSPATAVELESIVDTKSVISSKTPPTFVDIVPAMETKDASAAVESPASTDPASVKLAADGKDKVLEKSEMKASVSNDIMDKKTISATDSTSQKGDAVEAAVPKDVGEGKAARGGGGGGKNKHNKGKKPNLRG